MGIAYRDTEMMFSSDEEFINSEELSLLNYSWKHLNYELMVDLYNRMGWEVDEKIKQTNMQYDNESDCYYYDVDINDVHIKIQDTEDDIIFTYAILMLCRNISTDTKFFAEYACKIYEGIKECNLEDCMELIDNSKTKKVFIAMSFAETMKEARKSIEKAIKDSGYVPMLIDVKEHNNQIVPEIYKEIEECYFIIADLTGQRGGVYYEAGYAMAKEKPLILSCKKDKKEKPHFDVAQINTIFWQDEVDLYTRLVYRIRATIGENR